MIDQYTYLKLYQYCGWSPDCNDRIQRILASDDDIDIFYREGQLLKFAIKANDTNLLNMLIDYYNENTLKPKQGTQDYDNAYYKLCLALNEANKQIFEVLNEIQEVLNPYIKIFNDDTISLVDEKDSRSDEDLQDMRLGKDSFSSEQESKEDVSCDKHYVPLTEANLREWEKNVALKDDIDSLTSNILIVGIDE